MSWLELRSYEEIDESKRLQEAPNNYLSNNNIWRNTVGKQSAIDGVKTESVIVTKGVPMKVINNIGATSDILENISLNWNEWVNNTEINNWNIDDGFVIAPLQEPRVNWMTLEELEIKFANFTSNSEVDSKTDEAEINYWNLSPDLVEEALKEFPEK